MGDRATVVVETSPNKRVYLYTHWGGHNVPEALQTALRRRDRWNDAPYLTRFIWDAICPAEEHGGPLSFGISATFCDSEYDTLVVIPHTQTVLKVPLPTDFELPWNHHEPDAEWSFEEFCGIPKISWRTLEA